MRRLTPNPTKMEDPLLQELLQNADSEAPGELGSSDLQLLSLPLSQWKDVEHPVNFCIPAVPSESVRTAEETYHPYSNHWEDELLLQASQAFSQEQEEEEDVLLLAASQEYEKRCGPLMTSDDVQSAVVAQVPLNTKRNNNRAANTWQAWAIGRNAASLSEWVNPDLNSVTNTDLAVWTPRFVLEVRNKDGEHYPPNTLYSLVMGLQRQLRGVVRCVNLLMDARFFQARQVLDSEMRRLRGQGLGTKVKKAEPLTNDNEDVLWQKGVLGDHTPQCLLDTLIFYIGMNFALRSGDEHRRLRFHPCQIEAKQDENGQQYLLYTEDVSKNHRGGLVDRKVKPKQVVAIANINNPERCVVRLFLTYISKRPEGAPDTAFYLQPLSKYDNSVWYSRKPVGHNKIAFTVKKLCAQVGVEGYKTNHSLRRTAATRLFQAGCDEQLIMDVTGHRSTDGVREYKEVCLDQRKALSDVIQNPRKKVKHDV